MAACALHSGDELAHVRGEMVLGGDLGCRADGGVSDQRQQRLLRIREAFSMWSRVQFADELRKTGISDGGHEGRSAERRIG